MQDPAADFMPPSPPPEFPGQVLPRDMLTPALRSDPESFPVLKAFQEYIEAERERARRRLLTVSALSITAIVLIVAAFLAVGTVVIGALMRRNDLLLESVLRAAVRDAAVPPPLPTATAGDARSTELARLDAALHAIQSDYATLQGQVGALQALPATLATTMEQALSNLVARPAPTPVATAPSPPPPAGVAPFAPPVALPTHPATAPAAPAPAAVPFAPAPGSAAAASAATATPSPADRPARTTVISVPARVAIPPRIAGYAPARLTLVTDRGVAVPWRVVIPE